MNVAPCKTSPKTKVKVHTDVCHYWVQIGELSLAMTVIYQKHYFAAEIINMETNGEWSQLI